MLAETIRFQILPVNEVELHVALAGLEDGPPVLLLHGFPDAWFGWEAQIHFLAERGFRVIAPDQRGYNRSSVPTGVRPYALDRLVGDVLGLLDYLGIETVNLAGHDWGAAVAWETALRYPQRVRRLAIANVPHPAVMFRFLRRSPRQMLKSWYIAFFQIPGLADWLLSRQDFRLAARSLRSSGLPTTFSEEDIARYKRAWRNAGGMSGMLAWYRALVRYHLPRVEELSLAMPVLLLWGKRDVALSFSMAEASMAYCPQGRLVFFDEASHWVMRDCPQQVGQYLAEHFKV